MARSRGYGSHVGWLRRERDRFAQEDELHLAEAPSCPSDIREAVSNLAVSQNPTFALTRDTARAARAALPHADTDCGPGMANA